MDNKNIVTISLKDYTELVLEKQRLEIAIESCKRKAAQKVDEEIKDGLINMLSKEETLNLLNSSNQMLLARFGPASWTYSSISREVLILNEQEVKDLALELIIRKLNDHLKDLIESEK